MYTGHSAFVIHELCSNSEYLRILNKHCLVEVPEGILVDFGSSSTDENAQRVFDEAAVNDVTEMRDLVMGYRNQNMFLNQEVLGAIFS